MVRNGTVYDDMVCCGTVGVIRYGMTWGQADLKFSLRVLRLHEP